MMLCGSHRLVDTVQNPSERGLQAAVLRLCCHESDELIEFFLCTDREEMVQEAQDLEPQDLVRARRGGSEPCG